MELVAFKCHACGTMMDITGPRHPRGWHFLMEHEPGREFCPNDNHRWENVEVIFQEDE